MGYVKLLVLISIAVLLNACQSLSPTVPIQNTGFMNVKGKVFSKSKTVLPKGAKIIISLEEHGIMDIAAPIITQTEFIVLNQNFPIMFNLKTPAHALNSAHMPGFSVSIYNNQKVIFRNDTSMPYKPNKLQEIQVVAIQ